MPEPFIFPCMRYAIVTDIHANLQAWEAVLRDIASNRVDGIVCLGDVVGYGPNPAEVLKSVHRHVDALVLGNHDAALCGHLTPELFNDRARDILLWTRSVLAPHATDFIADWPLVLIGEGFRCAHGDFAVPGAFNYVFEAGEALPSWQATSEPLLFVGHTHMPGIFVIGASGTPHFLDPQDFVVEPGKRYLVSVCSVGFPRDADPRAGYCIYDTGDQSVVWRRIPFDIDAYRRALAAAGLPGLADSFMERDPLSSLCPIRAQLDFSPATRVEMQTQHAVAEQDLARALRRRVARWKLLAGLLLLLALLLGGTFLWHTDPPLNLGLTVPADALAPRRVSAAVPAPDGQMENLLAAIPAVATGAEISGWRYLLADRTRQSMAVSNACLQIISSSPDGRIRLESAPVDLAGSDIRRVCLSGRVRTSAHFSGTLELVADLVCENAEGNSTSHARREVKGFRFSRAGWTHTQKTFDLLKDTRYVTLAMEGMFTGSVEVAEISLTPVVKR